MREILFRGKRVDGGEWIIGSYFSYKDGRSEIWQPKEFIIAGRDVGGCWYFVDTDTVGQYTGLTDKNGVKVFEGDIVKYIFGARFTDSERIENAETKCNRKGVIEYKDGEFTPRPMREDIGDYWYSYGRFDFEVIGNIHDNPELLEGVV